MTSYQEILTHPHHQSLRHRPMSAWSRAAQFSPFAALTGYDEAVAETARLTDSRTDMTEDALAALNERFLQLLALQPERPEVTVTYFSPDSRKAGGAYLEYTGHFRFYDEEAGLLRFTDGTAIAAADIFDIRFPE